MMITEMVLKEHQILMGVININTIKYFINLQREKQYEYAQKDLG